MKMNPQTVMIVSQVTHFTEDKTCLCATSGQPRSQASPCFLWPTVWKSGRAWYLFSHEDDVIDNVAQKFGTKRRSFTHCLMNCRFNAQGVQQLSPTSQMHFWYLSSFCCSEPQCAHIQVSPFCHLCIVDITHEKDTRPSTFFMQPENMWAWEQD